MSPQLKGANWLTNLPNLFLGNMSQQLEPFQENLKWLAGVCFRHVGFWWSWRATKLRDTLIYLVSFHATLSWISPSRLWFICGILWNMTWPFFSFVKYYDWAKYNSRPTTGDMMATRKWKVLEEDVFLFQEYCASCEYFPLVHFKHSNSDFGQGDIEIGKSWAVTPGWLCDFGHGILSFWGWGFNMNGRNTSPGGYWMLSDYNNSLVIWQKVNKSIQAVWKRTKKPWAGSKTGCNREHFDACHEGF